MKPEIYRYDYGSSFLAVIKNGYIVDIACSSKNYDGKVVFLKKILYSWVKYTKVRARDLALYTHWPVHTQEFWDLLNET
jgi:hypothetical protein